MQLTAKFSFAEPAIVEDHGTVVGQCTKGDAPFLRVDKGQVKASGSVKIMIPSSFKCYQRAMIRLGRSRSAFCDQSKV